MIELIEAANGLAALLESAAEEERARRKKRRRDEALALGLIGNGTAVAKAAALGIPKRAPKRMRRALDVAGYSTVGPRGGLKTAVAIDVGDELYLARVETPGAGLVTRDPSGIPIGRALQPIIAGGRAAIRVTLYEKLWLTDGNPCEVCEENSIAGWIPSDRSFPSGHFEPLAHPNCKCSLETRRVD